MEIIERILMVLSSIWSIFSRLWTIIVYFFNNITEVIGTVVSIASTLWYWVRTLFSSVIDLTRQLFQGELFYHVWITFNNLSTFIWVPATIFLASLFLVVIVRIGISFVFKLLRLNANYNSLQKKNK